MQEFFFSIGRVRTVPFLDKKYRAASATSGPALRNGPGCRISKSSSQSTRNIVLTHADSYWNYYFLLFQKITLNFPKSVKQFRFANISLPIICTLMLFKPLCPQLSQCEGTELAQTTLSFLYGTLLYLLTMSWLMSDFVVVVVLVKCI